MLWKWIRSSSLPAGIIMMIHKKSMAAFSRHALFMYVGLEDLEMLEFRFQASDF